MHQPALNDFDPGPGTVSLTTSGAVGTPDAFVSKLSDCPIPQITISGGGAELSTAEVTGGFYQWIDCSNGQPILGALQPTYTATANGSYAVSVYDGNCFDQSDCVDVLTVGLPDMDHAALRIAPNPASSFLRITGATANASYAVINLPGQVLAHGRLSGTEHLLDVSMLAAGSYVLRVEHAGGTMKSQPFVVGER